MEISSSLHWTGEIVFIKYEDMILLQQPHTVLFSISKDWTIQDDLIVCSSRSMVCWWLFISHGFVFFFEIVWINKHVINITVLYSTYDIYFAQLFVKAFFFSRISWNCSIAETLLLSTGTFLFWSYSSAILLINCSARALNKRIETKYFGNKSDIKNFDEILYWTSSLKKLRGVWVGRKPICFRVFSRSLDWSEHAPTAIMNLWARMKVFLWW